MNALAVHNFQTLLQHVATVAKTRIQPKADADRVDDLMISTSGMPNEMRHARPAPEGARRLSMRLQPGDPAPSFDATDIDGARHELEAYRGRKSLVSFYRYAACPSKSPFLTRVTPTSLGTARYYGEASTT